MSEEEKKECPVYALCPLKSVIKLLLYNDELKKASERFFVAHSPVIDTDILVIPIDSKAKIEEIKSDFDLQKSEEFIEWFRKSVESALQIDLSAPEKKDNG